ncbi:hypothetical protein A0H81_12623 [Grifola frondosa]|uniref:Uncharacterized protein n=1 Tax=Grifola frondosa TaxID=5627 RepID=A0A1C7LRK3_GRIFR|nr:hypothetical protein A0H81_12623 [Grifola frondosa]
MDDTALVIELVRDVSEKKTGTNPTNRPNSIGAFTPDMTLAGLCEVFGMKAPPNNIFSHYDSQKTRVEDIIAFLKKTCNDGNRTASVVDERAQRKTPGNLETLHVNPRPNRQEIDEIKAACAELDKQVATLEEERLKLLAKNVQHEKLYGLMKKVIALQQQNASLMQQVIEVSKKLDEERERRLEERQGIDNGGRLAITKCSYMHSV